MHVERLRSAEEERYGPAMALYEESFPLHERRKPASQVAVMGHEQYQFQLIYEGETWVGLLLCWETEAFVYVEHFCIRPEARSRRYGQRALELLAGRGKTVILEIDPPVDPVSARRKAFYERAGYRENGFAHVHPPYQDGFRGHPLVVMSYPDRLSEAEYGRFSRYLRDTVMGV